MLKEIRGEAAKSPLRHHVEGQGAFMKSTGDAGIAEKLQKTAGLKRGSAGRWRLVQRCAGGSPARARKHSQAWSAWAAKLRQEVLGAQQLCRVLRLHAAQQHIQGRRGAGREPVRPAGEARGQGSSAGRHAALGAHKAQAAGPPGHPPGVLGRCHTWAAGSGCAVGARVAVAYRLQAAGWG